jgi:phosphate-selective porin OprO/OprP
VKRAIWAMAAVAVGGMWILAPVSGADEAGAGGPGSVPCGEEKTVAEEILDILKAQGSISESQYQELHERACAEAAELAQAAAPPPMSAGADARHWDVYWKDGLRVEDPDGKFKIRMGGRIQADWAGFDADSATVAALGEPDLDGGSGTEFRRARLYVSGTLWEHTIFKAQYDFAGGDVDFDDVYVGMTGIPYVDTFRTGHFKEAFSLNELTSSKYITFMERALPVSAFAPARNMGFGLGTNPVLDDRMTWALGFFRETNNFGDAFGTDGNWDLTGRITGLPYYADEGRKLLHLGFSFSHKFVNGDLSFATEPEAHLSPVDYVDTLDFPASGANLLDPEVAFIWGPLSVQGEFLANLVDSSEADDPTFWGWYGEVGYFLTGEHRVYSREDAAFERLSPKRNFSLGGGPGAWQLAARFSQLDLNSGNVNGGAMWDVTAGVNWWLNPNLRLSFNYVRSHLDDFQQVDGGNTNIFEGRVQVEF